MSTANDDFLIAILKSLDAKAIISKKNYTVSYTFILFSHCKKNFKAKTWNYEINQNTWNITQGNIYLLPSCFKLILCFYKEKKERRCPSLNKDWLPWQASLTKINRNSPLFARNEKGSISATITKRSNITVKMLETFDAYLKSHGLINVPSKYCWNTSVWEI